MVADQTLALLKLKSFELMVLPFPANWEYFLAQLSSGNINVLNFKVIILCLGRNDLELSHAEIEEWLNKVLASLKAINNQAKVVLAAILKLPHDSEEQRHQIKSRNHLIEARAYDTKDLYYFNGNLALVKYGSDRPVFTGDRCTLTGVIIIGRALRAWLRSTRILYHCLAEKEHRYH